MKHANIDDGEFWIELKDFIKFFTGVTICSLVPDFDKDGCKDELSKCVVHIHNLRITSRIYLI